MKKIITIGEALIDFIPKQKGRELKDVNEFEKKAGGAPANVAAAVAKCGGRGALITQVGCDAFGDFLVEKFDRAGIDTSMVFRTDKANTALAFVSLASDGNRSFSFYRKPCADLLLDESKICEDMFSDCWALHFCSVDLVDSPMKLSHKKAIKLAKEKGAIICFDPNLRLALFDDPEECKIAVEEFGVYADIMKVSSDELEFIFSATDTDKISRRLFDETGIKIFIVTCGGDGAMLYTRDHTLRCDPVQVEVTDTTGAGDSFIGSFLYALQKEGTSLENLGSLKKETYEKALNFANEQAAYTTTVRGGIV